MQPYRAAVHGGCDLHPRAAQHATTSPSPNARTQAAGDHCEAAAGLLLEQRGQRLRQADLAEHLGRRRREQ